MEEEGTGEEEQEGAIAAEFGDLLVGTEVGCGVFVGVRGAGFAVVDCVWIDEAEAEPDWDGEGRGGEEDGTESGEPADTREQERGEDVSGGVETLIPAKLAVEAFRADDAEGDGGYCGCDEGCREADEELGGGDDRAMGPEGDKDGADGECEGG